MKSIILVAGGTGHLGKKIITRLLEKKVTVRAIVRLSTDVEKVASLEKAGIQVTRVDMTNKGEVTKACMGATCVVSALSGLEDVIVDTQKILLEAAIAAAVP